MNDTLERALKTFLQAAGAVIIANLTMLANEMGDWAGWKRAAVPVLAGALAAGLSAAWNGVVSPWLKKGAALSPEENEEEGP